MAKTVVNLGMLMFLALGLVGMVPTVAVTVQIDIAVDVFLVNLPHVQSDRLLHTLGWLTFVVFIGKQ